MGGGVVGGWEKFQKQKTKKRETGWGGGRRSSSKKQKLRSGGKTKTKIRGEKKNWEGSGEKIKLQKKTEIRAEKGFRV
jgi:hypothetical protein